MTTTQSPTPAASGLWDTARTWPDRLLEKANEVRALGIKFGLNSHHEVADLLIELRKEALAAQPAPVDDDWHLRGYAYASKQATKCAQCGEYKHTPLRVDAMDGYVCLTCIDKKLEELLEAQPAPGVGGDARDLIGQLVSLGAMHDADLARNIAERLDALLATRPAESVAQCGTCNGHGMIGGHTGQTPETFDQWEAPCPECNPAAESVAQGGEHLDCCSYLCEECERLGYYKIDHATPTPATGSGGELLAARPGGEGVLGWLTSTVPLEKCGYATLWKDQPKGYGDLKMIPVFEHPAPAGGDAGERLCQIYFEIAAEAVGEEVVRAERDRRIAALTAKPGAEGSALAPGCGDGVG